jgi:hypothetical protein
LSDSPDFVAARRVARLSVVAVAALIAGIIVAFVVRQTSEGDGGEVRPVSGGATPTVAIGPVQNEDIAAYIKARSAELEGLDGAQERSAVASLTTYQTPDRAMQIVNETTDGGALEVRALLAAVPGDEPSVVVGSLDEWASGRRTALQQQHDDIAALLPTVDEPQFKAFYEKEVARLQAALDALDPKAPIVFGIVVRGPVSSLRSLARRAPVRLVDVARTADPAPAGATYRGLLPDEVTTVGNPQQR